MQHILSRAIGVSEHVDMLMSGIGTSMRCIIENGTGICSIPEEGAM